METKKYSYEDFMDTLMDCPVSYGYRVCRMLIQVHELEQLIKLQLRWPEHFGKALLDEELGKALNDQVNDLFVGFQFDRDGEPTLFWIHDNDEYIRKIDAVFVYFSSVDLSLYPVDIKEVNGRIVVTERRES